MSKPRHQPRSESDLKLRLRLPTDGSVDLDKLRAALEARLQKTATPEIVEVPEPEVVVPEPEPEVVLPEPKPEVLLQPSGFKVWLNTSAPTHILIFSGMLAAIVGSVYFGLTIISDDKVPSLLGWVFWGSLLVSGVAFGFVYFRQLEKEDSLASRSWNWMQNNQKRAGIAALVCIGLIVVVFLGLTVWQTPSSDPPSPIAKKKPDPPEKTVVIPPVPPPKTKETEKPIPPAQKAKPFKPAEGYAGRLGTVCGVFGLMGLGLFQLSRTRKKRFPDDETLQAGAKEGYIEFTRGFRAFVASQGGVFLVAGAVGALILVLDTREWGFEVAGQSGYLYYSAWSLIPWMLLGMALTIPLVMGLGAAGLDLMPTLDRKVEPWTSGSATTRFLLRKLWHIVFLGLVFGAFVSVGKVDPIQSWFHLWVKWSLVAGLIAGMVWTRGAGKQIDRPRPLSRKPFVVTSLLMFNLPLLFMFSGVGAVLVALMFGVNWLYLWWMIPISFTLALLLVAVVKSAPELMVQGFGFLVGAALLGGLVDLALDFEGAFWLGFGTISFLLILGMANRPFPVIPGKTNNLWILIPLKKKEEYREVIQPDRNGIQIRWGSLIGVVTVVIMLLISSGVFIWNGLGAENQWESNRGNKLKTTWWIEISKEPNQETVEERPPASPKTESPVEIAQPKKRPISKPPKYNAKGIAQYRAWMLHRNLYRDDPDAGYNLALISYFGKWGNPAEPDAAYRLWLGASEKNHMPSLYNAGVCMWYGYGTTMNKEEAIRCFKDASDRGFDPARLALGSAYQSFSTQVDLDQAQRDEYNKRAFEVLKGDKPLLSIPIDRSEERELPGR